jgi:hypothetical protein
MTLVLTIVRPSEGAWMCSDRMLSDSGTKQPLSRDADKIAAVECVDGPLLLGFAGLAEIDPRTRAIVDWVRETSRGQNRTIEQTIVHLTQRLNRDVYRHWRDHSLTVGGVAFVGAISGLSFPSQPVQAGQAWLYQVTNSILTPERQLVVTGTFEAQKNLIDQPVFAILGSGHQLLTHADRGRIQEIALRRPRRPDDFLGLLAALIRAIADRDEKRMYGVGGWSRGCYMPATGEPVLWKDYRGASDPKVPRESFPPQTMLGIDLTEITKAFWEAANAHWDGRITSAEFEHITEQAARRAVQGRE